MAMLIKLVIAVLILYAVAFGMVPFYSGFASDGDVKDLIRNEMNRDVVSVRRHQCEAVKERNFASSRFMTNQIDDIRTRHHEMFERDLYVPSCIEVGVEINSPVPASSLINNLMSEEPDDTKP